MLTEFQNVKQVFLIATAITSSRPPPHLLLTQLVLLLVIISKHSQRVASLYTIHCSKCFTCKSLFSLLYSRTGFVAFFEKTVSVPFSYLITKQGFEPRSL